MKEVLYRDDEGLSDLISEVEDLDLAGMATGGESVQEKSGSIKPKIGLGTIFELLGMSSVSVEGEVARKDNSKVFTRSEYATTQGLKYRTILRHLANTNRIYGDQYEAWCAARASGRSVFCEIEGTFTPAGWKANSDAWMEFANSQKMLVVHSSEDRSLIIGMSLSKIRGTRDGVVSPTCHLVMRTRTGRLRMHIFGAMDKTKYIKPYYVAYA